MYPVGLAPADVASEVESRRSLSTSDIAVFWVCVEGNRDTYASNLERRLSGNCVCLVVRNVRFDNANAVMNDLISILDLNRRKILERVANFSGRALTLVLLGRTEFPGAQSSSPVTLPEWYPDLAGREVFASIEDITWGVNVSLDADVSNLQSLREALFALEGALARRLRRMSLNGESLRDSNHLMELIRRKEGESLRTLVEAVEVGRQQIRAPRAFRPSIRQGDSLLARLWELWLKTPPQSLGKPAKALQKALAVGDMALPWREDVLTIFARPSEKDATDGQRYCRNMLVVVGNACQFVTSSAHADEYQKYPVTLLRSVSTDLLESLRGMETYLNST